MVQNLGRIMLVTKRALVIEHKAIFLKAIIAFAKILPEPTRENVSYPNTLIIMDIRDKFFTLHANPGRTAMYKAAFKILIFFYEKMWKIFICEYEHDPRPRHIFDWLVEELVEAVISGRWVPRPAGHPSGFWNEPRTNQGQYGLNRGRNFAKYIEMEKKNNES